MTRRIGKPSEAQVTANRMNAQKSTGPKTAEGKRISAANALKSTGPKTAKGKARSAFNAIKNGFWSEYSELRACIGCHRKCVYPWPPEECIARARIKGKLDDY
ncbi:MAG: hypothetical protein ACYC2T_08715 [Bacillota bacterium]